MTHMHADVCMHACVFLPMCLCVCVPMYTDRVMRAHVCECASFAQPWAQSHTAHIPLILISRNTTLVNDLMAHTSVDDLMAHTLVNDLMAHLGAARQPPALGAFACALGQL